MKKLLLTGLMSVVHVAFCKEIVSEVQKNCVKEFIDKTKKGKVAYSEVLNCFSCSSINDLSEEQFKEIIKQSVKISHKPYHDPFRISLQDRYPCQFEKAKQDVILFLDWVNVQRPLLSALNDLYLRNGRILGKEFYSVVDVKKKAIKIEWAIDVINRHIGAALSGKKRYYCSGERDYQGAGVADQFVEVIENLEEMELIKSQLQKDYSALTGEQP